jgi:hypothetical protein
VERRRGNDVGGAVLRRHGDQVTFNMPKAPMSTRRCRPSVTPAGEK